MIIGALPEAFAAFAETVDEVMKPWHRQYRRCRRSAQMHYGHELGGRLVREFMNSSPDARDVWALPEAIAEAAHGQPVSTDGLTSEAVASIEVADSVREAAREAARRAVDLMRAVCSEALLVNHGCVVDATRLREDLTKLTKTRNKVAQHRPVSDQDLATIRSVVATVLQPVGEHHPDLAADFVAARWDDAVETLMSDVTSGMQTAEPPEPGTMTEPERRVPACYAWYPDRAHTCDSSGGQRQRG